MATREEARFTLLRTTLSDANIAHMVICGILNVDPDRVTGNRELLSWRCEGDTGSRPHAVCEFAGGVTLLNVEQEAVALNWALVLGET